VYQFWDRERRGEALAPSRVASGFFMNGRKTQRVFRAHQKRAAFLGTFLQGVEAAAARRGR